MSFVLPGVPTYVTLGGPKPDEVEKLLPAALADVNADGEAMAGLSGGSPAADALRGDFSGPNAILAHLGDDQDFHWALPNASTDAGYDTITVTPLAVHGTPQPTTAELIPFGAKLLADSIKACQTFVANLTTTGKLGQLRSLSVSANGFPTCEWRCDWGGDNAPIWRARYPGLTDDQIAQQAIDGQVAFAQALDAMLPAGVDLVMSILDPGTLAGLGAGKDGGAWAAKLVAAIRAAVPSRTVWFKFESLLDDGVVPAVYGVVGGPMCYQLHVGCAGDVVPEDAGWVEVHIMNYESKFEDQSA